MPLGLQAERQILIHAPLPVEHIQLGVIQIACIAAVITSVFAIGLVPFYLFVKIAFPLFIFFVGCNPRRSARGKCGGSRFPTLVGRLKRQVKPIVHPVVAQSALQAGQVLHQLLALHLAPGLAQNRLGQRLAQIAGKAAQVAVRIVHIFDRLANLFQQHQQNLQRRGGVAGIEKFPGRLLDLA